MRVQDAANFFVYISNQYDENFIGNLKLNKLLYYAQGCYLARTGKLLFNEKIEAWKFGPIVPEIYRKYKVCGKEPIQFVDDDFDINSITGDELEALLDVEREFGKYTGSALVTMTHAADTPWSNTEKHDSAEITAELMKDYFTRNPVKRFSDELPSITTCPKDWYNPDEDSEWEGYLC